MWDEGEMFTVQEGTQGTVKEARWLPTLKEEGPYLIRFEYEGNPNGFYGVWVWARCLGISEPNS